MNQGVIIITYYVCALTQYGMLYQDIIFVARGFYGYNCHASAAKTEQTQLL